MAATKPWLDDGFSEALFERDISRLPTGHERLALAVFKYAVESLGSEPFQRDSSRNGKSDGQTIFRTKLQRSFWLVIDTKSGGLQLHFPDKEDAVGGNHMLRADKAPGTQWSRKKEKRIHVPHRWEDAHTTDALALVDEIHEAAVEYYSRGKDFSTTLRTLLGPARGGDPLAAPGAEEFAALLSNAPRCKSCGTTRRLNIHRAGDGWELYCDHHHPTPSRWAAIGAEIIPFEVRRHVWNRDGGRCVQCGSESYATFDHMIPANRGGGAFSGGNLEMNIRLKCRTCNFSKGNKLVP